MFARAAAIALAGFALLAAGEEPAPLVVETAALHAPEDIAEPAATASEELRRPASLARLVADIAALPATPLDRDAKCLARAVFFEARGEPLEGQLAVAQVILNRAASGKYPETVCAVIDQPNQFSFARRVVNTRSGDYRVAQAIAVIAQAEHWHEVAPRAMSFHASHVRPGWGGMQRVSRIGNHVFYR